MNRIVLSLIALCMLGFLAGCSAGGDVIALTKSDHGSAITVHKGDTIQLSLEGNPTTGYTWEWVPDGADFLKMPGEPEYSSEGEMLGAAGKYTFTFDVTETGSGELHLIYHRTFEPDVPPLEEFSVTITAE